MSAINSSSVSSKDLYCLEQLLRGVPQTTRFGSVSKTYAFGTENMRGYFPVLPLTDATVLTVAGSGDHLVNSYLSGAQEVTAFDSNLVSLAMTDLKLAALQVLPFEAFKRFFMINGSDDKSKNSQALNFDIYQQLRPGLCSQSQVIFDFSFEYVLRDGVKLRASPIFNNKYDSNTAKIDVNPYLSSEESFEGAKESAKNKQAILVNADLRDLASSIAPDKKFDIILLSNISDYTAVMHPGEKSHLGTFVKNNVTPLVARLNPQGVICVAYIYCTNSNSYRSDIDNPSTRKSVFDASALQWKEVEFASAIKGHRDSVILCGGEK